MATDSSTREPRLAALQHRDFRLLWIGLLISITGSNMHITAVNWHIYDLLRGASYDFSLFGLPIHLGAEALGLGTLGLVRVIPIILFALLGGMVADTLDRRVVMMCTQTAAALFAGLLALLTLTGHVSVPAIYLLTAANAAAMAFDGPARQAIIPNLVPREHLTNAISLNTLVFQIATVVGPMVAGVMIGSLNIGLIYAVNAVSYGAVIGALVLMNYRGQVSGESGGLGWGPLMEGLNFTYRSRIIWGTMLLDFFATFFSSARTLLPIVADEILHVGAEGYGVLSATQPVGSMIAGAVLALRKKQIYQQGVVLLVCVAIYGLATALFGISTLFALSFLFMALTGAADTVSTVIRNTVRQLLTPDRLRGRMTSVNMIFFLGGPQLGELEAGLLASAFAVPGLGAVVSIVSGGIITVLLTAWVAWRNPGLRRYTSDMHTGTAVAA
jgi:MFS family permease